MNKYWNKLKDSFDKNPLETIVVCAIAVTATAKLLDSMSAAQGRRAYAKQVEYRLNR